MRSTHEAALGSEGQWLRHLFSYPDTWVLVSLFLATQVLDSISTAIALSTGRFTEANPLMGNVVTAAPLIGYLSKVAIAALVLCILLLLRLRWRMRRMVIAILTVLSLVAPVANFLRVTGHL
jgi:hypothetical protein